MFVLTWVHTRKKTPMRRAFATRGQALLLVLTVRSLFPRHPFALNGQSL